MTNNTNNQIIISKNANYLLIGTIKTIKNPAITLINIKLSNDIIYLGEVINSNTTREWIEVNDQAVAIIGESNSFKMQYIKTLFYIPNKTFIYDNQNNLKTKFEKLFNIENNVKSSKIKSKKIN